MCHPSPCGQNTQCEVVNGIPTCKCLPGYHGSPIAGCRHECETSSECGSNLACIEFKCQNPCHSQCGVNADCEGVRNNAAVCKCPRVSKNKTKTNLKIFFFLNFFNFFKFKIF